MNTTTINKLEQVAASPLEFTFLGRNCVFRVYKNLDKRDRNAKSRCYVKIVNELLIDNLNNRKNRPATMYGEVLRKAFRVLEIEQDEYVKIRWSQKAGCSCPCSPGFIVDGITGYTMWVDFYANEDDIEFVTQNKPYSRI